MTNGEMIQKVFNCEVCEPIIEDDIIHVIFADKKDSAIGLDWSWWNAEYKEACEDAVSRQAVIDAIDKWVKNMGVLIVLPAQEVAPLFDSIHELPTVAIPSVEPKTGHCIDCKHFQKLPYHADKLGKCVQHWGFCPPSDWYCADFEPTGSEVNNG